MNFPRLVIAGTQSGVGKTTVTLAILAALKARGRLVQAFKAGRTLSIRAITAPPLASALVHFPP